MIFSKHFSSDTEDESKTRKYKFGVVTILSDSLPMVWNFTENMRSRVRKSTQNLPFVLMT